MPPNLPRGHEMILVARIGLKGRWVHLLSSRQTSHASGKEAALDRRDLCRARAIFNSLDLNPPP